MSNNSIGYFDSNEKYDIYPEDVMYYYLCMEIRGKYRNLFDISSLISSDKFASDNSGVPNLDGAKQSSKNYKDEIEK